MGGHIDGWKEILVHSWTFSVTKHWELLRVASSEANEGRWLI